MRNYTRYFFLISAFLMVSQVGYARVFALGNGPAIGTKVHVTPKINYIFDITNAAFKVDGQNYRFGNYPSITTSQNALMIKTFNFSRVDANFAVVAITFNGVEGIFEARSQNAFLPAGATVANGQINVPDAVAVANGSVGVNATSGVQANQVNKGPARGGIVGTALVADSIAAPAINIQLLQSFNIPKSNFAQIGNDYVYRETKNIGGKIFREFLIKLSPLDFTTFYQNGVLTSITVNLKYTMLPSGQMKVVAEYTGNNLFAASFYLSEFYGVNHQYNLSGYGLEVK